MEVNLKLTEAMKYVVETLAKEESIDEKTALRKLIYEGMKPYVLKLYSEGKISLTKTAELLNLSAHDVLNLTKTSEPEPPELIDKSRKYSQELLK